MPDLQERLDAELARRGLRTTDDGLLRGPALRVEVPRSLLVARVIQSAGEDAPTEAIGAFIDRLVERAAGLPSWVVARSGVRLQFMARSDELGDALHTPITPRAAAVLSYTDPEELLITQLTAGLLDGWHMPLQEVHDAAAANLDKLLADTEIVAEQSRAGKLGMLKTPSSFKASLLLAPSLRQRVEADFGWPVLAVAPCRDFAFVFSQAEQDALIPMLAAPVMSEYDLSAFPVTNEVLRISDDGVEALGAYGPE
jgi:hypothetical protein